MHLTIPGPVESIEDNQQIEIAIVGLLANMYRDDGQSKKFLNAFDESFASMAPIFKLPMRVAIQRATTDKIFFNGKTRTIKEVSVTSSWKLQRRWNRRSTRRRWRRKNAPGNGRTVRGPFR